jgi:transposase
MIKHSVGLDVSSKKINVCLSSIDAAQVVKVKASCSIANNLDGFTELEAWLKKHRKDPGVPMVMCMEATGIYHECCALFFQKKNYAVSIVLPNKAKRYIESLGLKSKTDSIDARGLAQMGAQQTLDLWEPLGDFYYVLRAFTRHYEQLEEQKTAVKNQLHAMVNGMYRNKMVEKQLAKTIALIEKQSEEIKTAIKIHIYENEEVKRKVDNICKIKGVAIQTVAVILAETGGFALFKNSKQLVSYAGYDVVENQSGKHVGKTKISKKGNSHIRRCLFMPAFSVVTYEQKPFFTLFNRTLEKHNIKMKSYVAVQKRLLTTIYALWKNNEAYDENYLNPKANIQEKEQGFPLCSALKKPEKNSRTISPAKQGKHPVSDHSVLPLC